MGILQNNSFMVYLYKNEKNRQIKKEKRKVKRMFSTKIQTVDLVITSQASITTTPRKQDTRGQIKW